MNERRLAQAVWRAIPKEDKDRTVKNRNNSTNMINGVLSTLVPTDDEITVVTPLTTAILQATGFKGISPEDQMMLLSKWKWMLGHHD